MEQPQSRFHGKVKVQKGDIEIQVNIFEDTREKVYQELNHAFVTLGNWLGTTSKPGAAAATAAAKPTAAGPGNGGAAANGTPANAPFCDECGTNDEVQLIHWTDKKTHQPKSGWKCQRCKKWAR
ncbi:MAG: hypothetical protein A2Y72_03575 [Chloroflexi bacterium RBG_13_53_26]|nr:MAG: hypothetical protein A2Y72_03575 [Chloroflexi bacterium RBG_13_53_26]